MPVVSKTSSAARLAIIYITVGALTLVWSSIYYFYLHKHVGGDNPPSETQFYWCYGFLLSGAVVLVIGLLLGPIGSSARPAEVAAPEVSQPTANTANNGLPQPVAQVMMPAMQPNGTQMVQPMMTAPPQAPPANPPR